MRSIKPFFLSFLWAEAFFFNFIWKKVPAWQGKHPLGLLRGLVRPVCLGKQAQPINGLSWAITFQFSIWYSLRDFLTFLKHLNACSCRAFKFPNTCYIFQYPNMNQRKPTISTVNIFQYPNTCYKKIIYNTMPLKYLSRINNLVILFFHVKKYCFI